MDFFEAVFSEMSRIVNNVNVSCHINTVNCLLFSYQHHCCFQALSCLTTPFPLQQPPRVLMLLPAYISGFSPCPPRYLDSASFHGTTATVLELCCIRHKVIPMCVLWGIWWVGIYLACCCVLAPWIYQAT